MFVFVDIGCNGRVSDSGFFFETPYANGLLKNKLSLPISKPLAGRSKAVPYVTVADDTFPLQNNIMKPYPYKDPDILRRIFNYRLPVSRAKRTVESAFGTSSKISGSFKAHQFVVLHNFFMKQTARVYALS